MVRNRYFAADPTKIPDFAAELDEKNKRFLRQKTDFIAQDAIVGKQEEAAAKQKVDFYKAIAKFAPTAKSIVHSIDNASRKRFQRKLEDWDVSPENMETYHEVRQNIISEDQGLERLLNSGLEENEAKKLLNMGGRSVVYANERLARQLGVRLSGYATQDETFQKDWDAVRFQSQEVQEKFLNDYAERYFQDFNPKGFSKPLAKDILEADKEKWIKTQLGVTKAKEISVNKAGTEVQVSDDYTLAFQTDKENGVAGLFSQRIVDKAESIPEFFTNELGVKTKNPLYAQRWSIAKAAEIQNIRKLINHQPPLITLGELTSLTKGQINHPGFGPEPVEIKKALFAHDGSTLVTLTKELEASWTSNITAHDTALKDKNNSIIFEGLKRINQLEEAGKLDEAKSAFDQLTVGLKGYTNDALKIKGEQLSSNLTNQTLDEQFEDDVRNRTLTIDTLNKVKETNPSLYTKYEPLVRIINNKDFKDQLKFDKTLQKQTKWGLNKTLSLGGQAVSTHLASKTNDAVITSLLKLSPEQLNDSNTVNQIVGAAVLKTETEYNSNGGGVINTQDKALIGKGLYAYNSRTGRFPNFDREILGIGKQGTNFFKTTARTIHTAYESQEGETSWESEDPENPGEGLYLDKAEIQEMIAKGHITQKCKDIAEELRIQPEALLLAQAKIFDPKIEEKYRLPGIEIAKIVSKDPFITAVLNSKGPGAVTYNQWVRTTIIENKIKELEQSGSELITKVEEAGPINSIPGLKEQVENKLKELEQYGGNLINAPETKAIVKTLKEILQNAKEKELGDFNDNPTNQTIG